MKKLFILFIVLFLPLKVNAVTKTLNVTATLGTLLTITETTAMNFGNIEVAATGGSTTFTLDYSDAVTSSGGQSIYDQGAKSGVYTISGSSNTSVSVSVGTIANLANAGNPELVTTITVNAQNIILDNSGSGTVKTGGTIVVPDNTPSGAYNGSFVLTVIY